MALRRRSLGTIAPSANLGPPHGPSSMTLNFRALTACRHGACGLALALGLLGPSATRAQSDPAQVQAIQEAATSPSAASALKQPNQANNATRNDGRIGAATPSSMAGQPGRSKPSEFELYVRGLPGGSEVRRFGFDLATGMSSQVHQQRCRKQLRCQWGGQHGRPDGQRRIGQPKRPEWLQRVWRLERCGGLQPHRAGRLPAARR